MDYWGRADAAPSRQVWFRAVDRLPDDERLHRRLLAYMSDYFLLDTATLPHGSALHGNSIVMASIDHAMWFHRPLRVDDWLLYAVESPSASGARGFRAGGRIRAGRQAGRQHGAGGTGAAASRKATGADAAPQVAAGQRLCSRAPQDAVAFQRFRSTFPGLRMPLGSSARLMARIRSNSTGGA